MLVLKVRKVIFGVNVTIEGLGEVSFVFCDSSFVSLKVSIVLAFLMISS